MVADGAHILLGMALILLVFRARRPEPYFVAVLAASIPDVDKFVFTPLLELGYLEGPIWVHRGVTHSLPFAVVLVGVLSFVGPWRAAAIGVASHICLDVLTGGVRLLAPFDAGLYGFEFGWLLLNVLAMGVSFTVLFAGLVHAQYGTRFRSALSRVGITPPVE